MAKAIERILIKGTNWIGDTIMATPAIEALRQLFPRSHIAILVKKDLAGLLKENPHLDEVIGYEDRTGLSKIFEKARMARVIKQRGFDLAVLFPNSFSSALTVWWARIPLRIGYNTDGRGILLTEKIDKKTRPFRPHQVEYYLEIVKALGEVAVSNPPRAWIAETDRMWAERFLSSQGWSQAKELVGLNPGATYGPAKRWLPERFVELARRLTEKENLEIIIFAGPQEVGLANSIARGIEAKVINAAGKTSLSQLAALIAKCDLIITNDTGPMHIAVAVGTPVVAIFGSTDPSAIPPYGNCTIVKKEVSCSPCLKRRCPRDFVCMRSITVEEVEEAAIKTISESRGSS